ncbi:MAG: ribonuclease P protein component [Parcubacteria group bacterium]
MLKRSERLARARDIEAVQRSGQTKRNAFFVVRYLIRPRSKLSRATVIVSKRVSKQAVVRNRLKRQVRALLSSPLRSQRVPMDVTVTIRSVALGKTSRELQKALYELFA